MNQYGLFGIVIKFRKTDVRNLFLASLWWYTSGVTLQQKKESTAQTKGFNGISPPPKVICFMYM